MSTKFTKTRPIVPVPFHTTDIYLEVLGWVSLMMLWALSIFTYQQLPDTIPYHFDLKGQADAYGNKLMVLLLPILPTIIFVGLTVLNRYPHIFNYPFPITSDNAPRQYSLATSMLRSIRLVILIIFMLILVLINQAATNQITALGKWFFPITMLLTFVPLMVYLVVASQKNNHKQGNS